MIIEKMRQKEKVVAVITQEDGTKKVFTNKKTIWQLFLICYGFLI